MWSMSPGPLQITSVRPVTGIFVLKKMVLSHFQIVVRVRVGGGWYAYVNE